MKKIFVALFLAAAVFFLFVMCSDEDFDEYDESLPAIQMNEEEHYGDPNQTWNIYWYLCGSDLESDGGASSIDLQEMMEVELPDNVQFIIETGGAYSWDNDFVDPDYLERYVYNSEGLELVDRQPLANMGKAETLADFLSFCKNNYPADKTMVIFWNHGGGSVSGVAFDENYSYDSLTLSEMYEAFAAVYPLSEENPPIDVVGFDACLMGSIDTAYAFSDIAHYMVASEEWEPGLGWYYTGWVKALANAPGMDGALLGKAICDSYMKDCERYWQEDETTLSVVDLSQIDPLLQAYEAMGAEALTYAAQDPTFFAEFGRMAEISENYGGNTRDQGYANLVDLGHLAENCSRLLPKTSQAVQRALEKCVVYRVNGPYREYATGLSCYYSYNGDLEDFYGYLQQGCSDSFKFLFGYELTGELPQEGMEYVNSLGYEEEYLPQVPVLTDDPDAEYPLYLDEEGTIVLELDQDTLNMLKGVYFQLAYIDVEDDIMLLLGQDNDIIADWENGIFQDNFRNVWGAIDGNLVYMEVAYESDSYTAYAIPILLNGEEYNLRVIYDYDDEKFYIAGARKGLDENGMSDKNLTQLRPGDEITTLHYASTLTGDDDLELVPVDTFTVTKDTEFDEVDLGDGTFILMFEMEDAKGNTTYSEMVQLTAKGEYTDVEILE